jgi:hypothetical protein
MMAVQVRIEDLHHPEGGHAQIVFTGVGRVAAEWIVIRRFENQENYLSPEGWRGPETHIAPLEVADVPGGVALTIGPDVTEWLEYGERIEVALVDSTYRAIALWPEIGGWTGQRRRSGRTVIGSHARPPAPRPQQPPPQQPQPTVVPGLQNTVIAPRSVLPPAPPPAPVPVPPAPPPAAAAAPASRRNSWIAALVLLLILGAGGGYYGYNEWLRPDDAPPAPPSPPVPPNPPVATDPNAPVDLATLVNRPPEEVFRMAEQLYTQGSYSIAFSLFDDASRRGYGPAHTRIATFYDPATFQEGKPFQRANPRKALEHFDAAIAAADDSARAPREALVERLREVARGTDPAAREAQAVLRDNRL